MAVPVLNLVAQYRTLHEEIDQAICGVVESGQFVLGPHVRGL
jgi:hypothetical protein